MEDNFLIKQTLNGNRNAFRLLVLRYQKPIFKTLGLMIYDSQLVEELAQETFFRAYKSLNQYDPEKGASFSTWLFTIAKNLAFNELEKKKIRKNFLLMQDQSEPTTASGADDALESHQDKLKVRNAIEKLPSEFKMAVVLSCLDGHSIAEIAQIEKCSEGTVKSRIFRGKKLLKEILTPFFGGTNEKNV